MDEILLSLETSIILKEICSIPWYHQRTIIDNGKGDPTLQSDLAQQTTKDPYVFNFLTMTEDYNERELEDALVANVTKFLVELGTGFLFASSIYTGSVHWTDIKPDPN